MRIVCPACEAEYDVPDSVAGTGRKVRCARCQTVWLAAEGATEAVAETKPPADAFAAAEAAPSEPAAEAAPEAFGTAPLVADPPLGGQARTGHRPAEPALADLEAADADEPRRGRRGAAPWIAAWVLSLAVVSAAAWAGYHWRSEVMRVWPASERLYAMLGPVAEHATQLPADTHAANPANEEQDRTPHRRE